MLRNIPLEVCERRDSVRSIPNTYTHLLSSLCQALPTRRVTHVQHVALWVWRLLRARHWALGRVADALPIEGTKASRIRRLTRWLMHSRRVVDPISGPLVRMTVRRWHRPELTLVLNRTEWGVLTVLLGGVAVLGRVRPLAWTLLPPCGSSNVLEHQALVERVRPWLPVAPQQAIWEDGECKRVEVMRSAQHWGWDFGVGQAADTRFQGPEGTWQRLGERQVPKDRSRSLHRMRLTRDQAWGPVNVIAYWDRTKQEQRSVATSRPATRATFTWGRQQSGIVGLFREDTSGGFHLEDTPLTDADRLNRLLVVMAIGSRWGVHGGRGLVKTGQRKLVDAAKRRTVPYVRLGFDWIRRAITIGQPVKIGFAASTCMLKSKVTPSEQQRIE